MEFPLISTLTKHGISIDFNMIKMRKQSRHSKA